MNEKMKKVLSILVISMLLTGCGQKADVENQSGKPDELRTQIKAEDISKLTETVGVVTTLDISDMFTDRDKETEYDTDSCEKIVLQGSSGESTAASVKIEGSIVTITKEGSYILSGNLQNGTVIVDVDKTEKVQLILDGAHIVSDTCAAIYVRQADKVFITTAAGSENSLTNTGEFVAIDDNNIDGAIFSKEDLTLNGGGSLQISSEYGHGVVAKDDLVITGGNIGISAAGHGLSGKDSVRIGDGEIRITAGKDGINAGNEEEEDKGFVYIAGGSLTMDVKDDGIHGETQVVIADGNLQITNSYEGIEGKTIEITGGTISVVAGDDGLNATDGSGDSFGFGMGRPGAEGVSGDSDIFILISGGKLTVKAGGDGGDSNGALYVTGGETYISGPENSGNGALDYASEAYISGGTFVALGASGMAMNFGSSSTQGSMLVNSTKTQQSGSIVELKDSEGKVLVSFESMGRYSSVVVSCPEIKVGASYTLTMGDESMEITMSELLYGSGMGGFGGDRGMGGFGGGRDKGDFGGGRDFPGGERPQGEMPEGMPQMPRGEMPSGRPGMPQ